MAVERTGIHAIISADTSDFTGNLNRASSQLSNFQRKVKVPLTPLQQFGKKAGVASSALSSVGSAFTSVGRSFATAALATAPFTLALGRAIAKTLEFQDTLAKFKAISGATA